MPANDGLLGSVWLLSKLLATFAFQVPVTNAYCGSYPGDLLQTTSVESIESDQHQSKPQAAGTKAGIQYVAGWAFAKYQHALREGGNVGA